MFLKNMAKSAETTKPKPTTKSVHLSKQEPRPKHTLKTLLFDRLINDKPNENKEHPGKVLANRAQVFESIVNEVSRLLNTRLSATAKIYSQYKNQDYGLGLPWMYGIPDFTSMDPADKTQWWKITKFFETAINYFEPRLKNVKISLDHFDGESQRLFVSIRGHIVLSEFQQPVTFGVEVTNMS